MKTAMMRVAFFVLVFSMLGCGTVVNLWEGPVLYGGVRTDFASMKPGADPEALVLVYDLPCSAILDTVLLPLTGLFELLRLATGWPPWPESLD